jgi:hypothetical protein
MEKSAESNRRQDDAREDLTLASERNQRIEQS